jgi:hypothetical protein
LAAARAGADFVAVDFLAVDLAGARLADVERAEDVDVERARDDAAGFLAGGIDSSSVQSRALERLHATVPDTSILTAAHGRRPARQVTCTRGCIG